MYGLFKSITLLCAGSVSWVGAKVLPQPEPKATLASANCSHELLEPSWGIFIDGKNASEGRDAYGQVYTRTMMSALKVIYEREQKRDSAKPLDFGDFEAIRHLLQMPWLETYGGLFEMQKPVGMFFRQAFECVKPLVPATFLEDMFHTDVDDLYDAGCLPNGRPCRNLLQPVQGVIMKLFESYEKHQRAATTSAQQLRVLASLMKNLALLHPLPDRNGRSRLLLLQLELRRLKLACGTMNFNNNQNVYTDSVETLASKIQEGIDMYNVAMATGQNPWLQEGNVAQHRERFPQQYESELKSCTSEAPAYEKGKSFQ